MVAGFPGAGETTIRVDGRLLCTTDEETELIGSGCRCCTIRADLVDALRGRAQHAGRVVIETSRRADPWPILRTFMTDRALGAEFHVDATSALTAVALREDLSRFVLTEDRPLAWEAFSRAMETLVATRGADVLLAEGFLNVEGCRGPVAVQSMQHLSLPPVELAAWPDGNRRSRISFITRGIPADAVRGVFDAVRALA
jgi:G3E family GTPase